MGRSGHKIGPLQNSIQLSRHWKYPLFGHQNSFLPFTEHSYKQAPYQDCTKVEYEEMVKNMPKRVNWSKLSDYEQKDFTVASQEFACIGNSCEIIDLPIAA